MSDNTVEEEFWNIEFKIYFLYTDSKNVWIKSPIFHVNVNNMNYFYINKQIFIILSCVFFFFFF